MRSSERQDIATVARPWATEQRTGRQSLTRSATFLVWCLFVPIPAGILSPLPASATQPYTATFEPQPARFVRLLIHSTNRGQPAIDEIEIFGSDGKSNLALASHGAKASASSCLSGYAIHQIAHLNDGQYGNEHSWIAASTSTEWAQIELPEPARIARITLSRDREGRHIDRIPVQVDLQLSSDGHRWQTVAQMKNQAPAPQAKHQAPPYNPPADLPEPFSWDGLLRYAFLCERATWERMDREDHLSPYKADQPAFPGGTPYWGKIAKLPPTERALTQFADLIERLAAKGADVNAEREQLAALRQRQTADDGALYLEARLAKRQLMFRDPDLASLERVLFVKRHPYLSSHNYSDVLDSQFVSGGGICALDIPRTEGRLAPESAKLTTLFDASGGIARDPMADFDGTKIYFAFRPDKVPTDGEAPYWHMWVVGADGSGARQLTDGPFHDYYPCPLPDGGLTFISTRCRARFLCWRPQAFVLFRMDGDEIRPLSYANLSEWTPAVMRDGRILWTRSEYIDKGADFGHTLWAIRPDGTHPELIFGNNTPNCYINGREVPDTRELLCTLFSHGGDHNGPLGLIDLAKADGPSDPDAITNITPDTRPHYNMSWPRHECWRDPVPLTRDYFLASHAPANRFGLYLVDRYGNRELLYLDPKIGSMTPSPLRPVTHPPELTRVPRSRSREALAAPAQSEALTISAPTSRSSSPNLPSHPDNDLGQFVVADIYQGLGPNISRGKVKFLRVCQEVRADLLRLPDGSYQADHQQFQDWYATPIHKVKGPHGWPSYVAKASLGIVPIESDGSASFYAPAGKVLYLQALDESLNELQRMRSVIQLQPGEQRGCVGCHEHRHSAAPVRPTLAARRPPSTLQPPPWGAVPFAYERVVQPVWDKHCISCHGAESADGGIRLTGATDKELVPASYRALIEGGFVHYFDMTYKLRHEKAEPATFGTLQSQLTKFLEPSHYDVRLTPDEIHSVKCWIDLNCPLWPDYQYRPERSAAVVEAPLIK